MRLIFIACNNCPAVSISNQVGEAQVFHVACIHHVATAADAATTRLLHHSNNSYLVLLWQELQCQQQYIRCKSIIMLISALTPQGGRDMYYVPTNIKYARTMPACIPATNKLSRHHHLSQAMMSWARRHAMTEAAAAGAVRAGRSDGMVTYVIGCHECKNHTVI